MPNQFHCRRTTTLVPIQEQRRAHEGPQALQDPLGPSFPADFVEVFPDQPPAGDHVGREEYPDEAKDDKPGYGKEVHGTLELVAGVPLLVEQD